ncbi:PPE family protein [Mycobacterium sp. SMC-2]|uniref:PPE family protein n=1 Tax=Mycobacterium sp. SMC-2 TaxID=2857058 RepID=UPI0021B1C1E0|nr:PPE family protein [Mycobacterium sp. SMC-2]UXA05865.1 PPE family protein [Mycobacterium sp. SMC-2]
MIDFGALPPEFNSARMYAGPGPVSLVAAAVAWDSLAAELSSAASCYRSVIAGLTTGRWLGPSSLTMASAFAPYMAWTAGAAARAAEAAGQARLAVEIYEAAFAMTVPPPAVEANRVQLATLIATNFFGQNSAAIAATEAEYGEMWAQDAAAMYQYAAGSAAACEVTPFAPPPQVTNPAGLAEQATAVGRAAAGAGSESLADIVSSVPTTLTQLAAPTASLAAASGATVAATDLSTLSPALISLATTPVYAIPSYFMAAATPLYVLSSSFAIAQTGQGMQATANAEARAAAAAEAANPAASGGAAPSLTSSVKSTVGKANSLGPLSVPASWTSVIPEAKISTAAALANGGLDGANVTNVPPSVLGGAPSGLGRSGRSVGPRYGTIPTVMTRPPAAGYA